MNLYGIPGTNDPAVALAAAVSYWCWRSRDYSKFKNKAIWEQWRYFQDSIANSAVTTKTLEGYINNLAGKMHCQTLGVRKWNDIINPELVILRAQRQADGTLGSLMEFDQHQVLPAFRSWNEILAQDLAPKGIAQRHLLELLRPKEMSPRSITYLIATYCQARHEEDLLRGIKEEDEAIETEAVEV